MSPTAYYTVVDVAERLVSQLDRSYRSEVLTFPERIFHMIRLFAITLAGTD